MDIKEIPTIKTDRLILRPYVLADAPSLKRLIGEKDVAATTINIPHPYPDQGADDWIKIQAEDFLKGTQLQFAITTNGDLIGGIGFDQLEIRHARGGIGYWIGKPYWNNGYCTEAAKTVLKFGFLTLGFNRIHATCMVNNIGSSRVLQKIGMKKEGVLRQYYKRWGTYRDMEMYSILKGEYNGD